LVLYKIDHRKTDQDDVYGESLSDQIQFHTPIEFDGYVSIEQPQNQDYGNSKLSQMEPGNLTVSVYKDTLERLGTDIDYGDYIGYYETEDRVRYYSVVNDGRVTSDNKHTYGGFKPFYRTIVAAPVSEDEFRGL
jgi:hypothetical protein